MKNARQGEIIKIIQSMDVETQDQLLEELRARGFSTTQATCPTSENTVRASQNRPPSFVFCIVISPAFPGKFDGSARL
mgnify:CR=1 FL=1